MKTHIQITIVWICLDMKIGCHTLLLIWMLYLNNTNYQSACWDESGVAINTGTTPGLICFHQELVSSDEFLDHPHLMEFY
jgi:hypothetical protein